jgi:hypothetical protein
MNVTTVSANIKYSAEAKGAWRTIELGAEAAVAPNEDWHIAQEQLYHRLGQQMKSLWNNGSGSGKALSGSESHVQPTPPTSSPPLSPSFQSITAPHTRHHSSGTRRTDKPGAATGKETTGVRRTERVPEGAVGQHNGELLVHLPTVFKERANGRVR